jgi:hypothetical protein
MHNTFEDAPHVDAQVKIDLIKWRSQDKDLNGTCHPVASAKPETSTSNTQK